MKVLLLLVGILLHVSLQVSAVEMFEGEFILMPCEFPTHEADQPTVVWTRSDLSPSIVHQRQKDGNQLKDQNQLYRGRTFMKPDALETGELTLNLTNLQVSDTGTYTCRVRTSKGEGKVTDIELLVKERFPSWAIGLLVLLVLVLIVSAALLYYFWKYFMPVSQVVVDSEVKSVLLPWRTRPQLPRDTKVEWKDENNRTVHVYENNSDKPEEQDQFYKDRTKMKKNPLKTGDLSLTLERPTDADTNTYTCTVYDKDRNILKEKEVNLQVKVSQVVVDSEVESVLLPWRTAVHLTRDTKVVWKDEYNRTVHVYENGSDQPEKQAQFYSNRTKMNNNAQITGDLSLTLERPTDADTNTYTCTVYDREGEILKEKEVNLQVKVSQVVVDSDVESVLLPCRTRPQLPRDTKVEWKDEDNRTVHVYENGKDLPEEQDQFYKDRTKMKKNPLKTGDLSLTLERPTDEDSNVYTCTVYDREGNMLNKKHVNLQVKVSQVVVDSEVESVLLPWRTAVHLTRDTKVVWKDEYNRTVHVYENGSDQPEKQAQFYSNRTKMNNNAQITGDLSLTLERPTDADTNTYTCTVYDREGEILKEKEVNLQVKVSQVVVDSDMESVLLPCRTRPQLPRDTKVEWKDEYNRTVHVYENGKDLPEEQDQFYKDRTKMKKNPLRTGDLSLTLEHPTDEDSNVYTCAVYDREGNMLNKKHVNLQVKVPPVKVDSGEKSVLLPCRTNVQLLGDATVEWRDSKDWKVHVYENGSDHLEDQYRLFKTRTKMNEDLLNTGDLSLTLSHPTNKDTDIYTCIVSNREGKILMKKQVNLQVKVQQVVVDSDVDSFLLPCKTTDEVPGYAKIEWWDDRDKKVHVYEDSSDQPEEQDLFYSNRTKMKEDLKSGDFSLTLKYPTDGDSNIYTCTVYDSEENILMIKQLELKVKVCQVEVEEEAESVQLSFITAPDLPKYIKVEWRNRDGKMVHLYIMGFDQPEKQNHHYKNRTKMNKDLETTGDLSLNLICPTKEDRGEYKCTIWTKGKLLRWKTFQLIIKDQPEGQQENQPEDQSEGIALLRREGSDPGLTRAHQDTQQLHRSNSFDG
ncbi:uncharacterized protein V3H82_014452 isoform 3-T3 [Fundulus diaphanus]